MTIKNENSMDVHLNFVKDMSQMFVDFEDLHDSGGGAFDMVFINKTIDLCMFFNNRKSNALFDIIYRIFSDYGDLPKRCPIRRVRNTKKWIFGLNILVQHFLVPFFT